MDAIENRTRAWIVDARFDCVFFFGSALAALGAGALAVSLPALALPLWWLWLGLLDGPHFAATWARTYLDERERKRRGALLGYSLLWFVPGIVALIARRLSGSSAPFDLYLAFATLWSFHHFVRQHYGIMSVYAGFAHTGPRLRRFDGLFLHGALWTLFGLFLLAYPWNRAILGLPDELPLWASHAARGGAWLLGLAVLAYAISIPLRKAIKPALFVLVPAVATLAASFFVIGAFEPVVANPTNPEQASFAVAIVGGTLHALQYLGIIFATNRRRYPATEPARLAVRLGQSPWLAYACFVTLSLGYLVINAARGASPIGSLFAYDSDPARLFLAIYWGLSLHHYYIDQRIWHPRTDPALRYELGLSERPA